MSDVKTPRQKGSVIASINARHSKRFNLLPVVNVVDEADYTEAEPLAVLLQEFILVAKVCARLATCSVVTLENLE